MFVLSLLRAPYLDNMQCMLMPQSHKQKKIYIGGYSGHLCEMDFDRRTLLRQVRFPRGKSEFHRFVVLGHTR